MGGGTFINTRNINNAGNKQIMEYKTKYKIRKTLKRILVLILIPIRIIIILISGLVNTILAPIILIIYFIVGDWVVRDNYNEIDDENSTLNLVEGTFLPSRIVNDIFSDLFDKLLEQ